MVLDGKHLKIKGIQYFEYLAFDTKLGLVNRCLRRGGESTWGYRTVLTGLETIGYQPYVVVSDGGSGIYSALKHFKVTRHQRCHVHLLRDLRVGLRVVTKRPRIILRKYYVIRYAKLLLSAKTKEQFKNRLDHFNRVINLMWQPHGDVEINTVKSFVRTLPLAFIFLDYDGIWNIPKTTNILEGYISRLNARLKTMRGLKSPANAERILVAIHVSLK